MIKWVNNTNRKWPKTIEMWDENKLVGVFGFGAVQYDINKKRMEAFYKGFKPENLLTSLKTRTGVMEKIDYRLWKKRGLK